jgi:CRISPR-associated protein Cmr2
MQLAKRTNELWGASYIFSYMMKRIINEFRKDREFIVPYAARGDNKFYNCGNGVGLFHDRLIFKSEEGDFEKLGVFIDKLLDEIAFRMTANISEVKKKNINQIDVYEYIKKYFLIYYIEKTEEELGEVKNPILKMSKYLDAVELRETFVEKEIINYLSLFLDNEVIKKSFLMVDALGETEKKIPSLIEIATRELTKDHKEFNDIKDEESLIKEIENHLKREDKLDQFKKIHKYIAIVQADGDFMSILIKSLEKNQVQAFSKDLMTFAYESNKIIQKFEGKTIYAGGDDLLFFAPIIYKGETIFERLDKICKEFNEIFEKYMKHLDKKPSLSFGVSISYYKYPLYEALDEAGKLLFEQAKKATIKEQEKNAIAFKVLKHSGQFFTATFNKDSETYKIFKGITKKYLNDRFLTSVNTRLDIDKKIIEKIGTDKERLSNYFKNNFDESIHDKEEIKDYIEKVKKLIFIVFDEFDKEQSEIIFSILKFVQFINEKGTKNE